jgi:hypothetical protein
MPQPDEGDVNTKVATLALNRVICTALTTLIAKIRERAKSVGDRSHGRLSLRLCDRPYLRQHARRAVRGGPALKGDGRPDWRILRLPVRRHRVSQPRA